MSHRETGHALHRHLDVLLNFVIFHHTQGQRPPGEREQLDAAIIIFKEFIMNINEALDAAKVQAEADKKTIADDVAKIATLQAEIAAVPQVDPVKAKALVDAVMGGDTATMPAPAAV